MPDRAEKLTDARDLGAYVIAHVIGRLCANRMWWTFDDLLRPLDSLAVSVLVPQMVTVLLVLPLFLTLRRGMRAAGGLREAFSGPHEIELYLIAHAFGLLFTYFFGMGVYYYLYTFWGFRSSAGTIVTLVTEAAVLLIFLFLRRRVMTIRYGEPTDA